MTGLLGIGLFYLAHQRFDFLIAIPILALGAAVLVAAPIVAVLYGLNSDLARGK